MTDSRERSSRCQQHSYTGAERVSTLRDEELLLPHPKSSSSESVETASAEEDTEEYVGSHVVALELMQIAAVQRRYSLSSMDQRTGSKNTNVQVFVVLLSLRV